jgi:glycosyltransferase involved in cell wall biosynthesis
MRVIHIITRMIIGGAQENTLFNCLDLIEHYGDDVLLVTGPALGPEGKLLEQGRAGGLPIQFIDPLRRAIHPRRDTQAYWQLKQVIGQYRPDVVHTHSAKAGFLGRWAAHNLGVPLVIHTVHGAPFHPYQNFLARQAFIRLERWASRRCQHMISVADAMTDLMVSAQVAPREKFTTIYSGMDVEPFATCQQFAQQARREMRLPEDAIVIGKIARLFHLKGHEYLIEAAQAVIAHNPRVHFLLVGDGILRDKYQQRIDQLGMTSNFRFVGLVPPERVPYYLSAMDVLVHTSLREGLARTLPQALIAGKPVISYDIDGAREVVLPGETGILLPPKSVASLAEAIVSLANDSQLRYRLGARGAQLFTEQFRHQYMTQRIREIYQRELAR